MGAGDFLSAAGLKTVQWLGSSLSDSQPLLVGVAVGLGCLVRVGGCLVK